MLIQRKPETQVSGFFVCFTVAELVKRFVLFAANSTTQKVLTTSATLTQIRHNPMR